MVALAFLPWLYSAFVGLSAYFVGRFTYKTAVFTAFFLVSIGLVIAFTVVVNVAIASLSVSAPNELVGVGFSLLPGNTGLCFSTLVTVHFAKYVLAYKLYFSEQAVKQVSDI